MIKQCLVIYSKLKANGTYFLTTIEQINIPSDTLFNAVDYAHNVLDLNGIKEVREVSSND